MFNFRSQHNAELLLHGSHYPGLECKDFFRSSLSCRIDYDKRLILVYSGISLDITLPSAFLYKPCGRNLYKSVVTREMRDRTQVFLFGYLGDLRILFRQHKRIAEETARASGLFLSWEFIPADINYHFPDLGRSQLLLLDDFASVALDEGFADMAIVQFRRIFLSKTHIDRSHDVASFEVILES